VFLIFFFTGSSQKEGPLRFFKRRNLFKTHASTLASVREANQLDQTILDDVGRSPIGGYRTAGRLLGPGPGSPPVGLEGSGVRGIRLWEPCPGLPGAPLSPRCPRSPIPSQRPNAALTTAQDSLRVLRPAEAVRRPLEAGLMFGPHGVTKVTRGAVDGLPEAVRGI
jgi:hypothetical protein